MSHLCHTHQINHDLISPKLSFHTQLLSTSNLTKNNSIVYYELRFTTFSTKGFLRNFSSVRIFLCFVRKFYVVTVYHCLLCRTISSHNDNANITSTPGVSKVKLKAQPRIYSLYIIYKRLCQRIDEDAARRMRMRLV